MKIDFQFTTVYGVFSDALWFPDDQPLPSENEINTMKMERLNNWMALVTPVQEISQE